MAYRIRHVLVLCKRLVGFSNLKDINAAGNDIEVLEREIVDIKALLDEQPDSKCAYLR